ncbi:hypothetical protein PFISCL1PPCAC_10348, partial [Pristionchus fissidentatus]
TAAPSTGLVPSSSLVSVPPAFPAIGSATMVVTMTKAGSMRRGREKEMIEAQRIAERLKSEKHISLRINKQQSKKSSLNLKQCREMSNKRNSPTGVLKGAKNSRKTTRRARSPSFKEIGADANSRQFSSHRQ